MPGPYYEPMARQMAPMMTPEEIIMAGQAQQQHIDDQRRAQKYALEAMAAQHGYSKEDLALQHQNSLESIAKQLSGQKTLQDDRIGSENTIADRNRATQVLIGKEHNAALESIANAKTEADRKEREETLIQTMTGRLTDKKVRIPDISKNDGFDVKYNKLASAWREYLDNEVKAGATRLEDYDSTIGVINRDKNALTEIYNPVSDRQAKGAIQESYLNLPALTGRKDAYEFIGKRLGNGVSLSDAVAAADKKFKGLPRLDDQLAILVDQFRSSKVGWPEQAKAAYDGLDKQLEKTRQQQESFKNTHLDSGEYLYQRQRERDAGAAKAAADDYGPMAGVFGAGSMGLGGMGGMIGSASANQRGLDAVANGAALPPPPPADTGHYSTGALADPDVRAILGEHHSNWGQERGDVILSASQRISDAQQKLMDKFDALGANIVDGKIEIPTSVPAGTAPNPRGSFGQSSSWGDSIQLGVVERNKRFDQAVKLREKIAEMDRQQRKLFMSRAAEAHAASAISPRTDVIANPNPGVLSSMFGSRVLAGPKEFSDYETPPMARAAGNAYDAFREAVRPAAQPASFLVDPLQYHPGVTP